MFSRRKDRFKSVFFGWVFYKCILGSKGKTKEKKNLSCILISHCLESTFHLIKAHHVCKTEITTLLKCVITYLYFVFVKKNYRKKGLTVFFLKAMSYMSAASSNQEVRGQTRRQTRVLIRVVSFFFPMLSDQVNP